MAMALLTRGCATHSVIYLGDGPWSCVVQCCLPFLSPGIQLPFKAITIISLLNILPEKTTFILIHVFTIFFHKSCYKSQNNIVLSAYNTDFGSSLWQNHKMRQHFSIERNKCVERITR